MNFFHQDPIAHLMISDWSLRSGQLRKHRRFVQALGCLDLRGAE